jgi:tripartite-type tricarboxylate transporter receptor subunit TctC
MNTAKIRPALITAVLALCMGGAQAQTYPSKPVRVIVPFAAGGPTDTFARQMSAKLGENLGQPFVVDTRAGAAGNIGAEAAARSPADGYTLVLIASGHAINATLYKSLSYDMVRDFAPITLAFIVPNVLIVHDGLNVRTLKELIALSKSRPGKLTYGSSGAGSIYHLQMELLKTLTGMDLLHVPYKGAPAARADVMSRQIDMVLDAMSVVQPIVAGGKVRALASTSVKRSKAMPDLPTIAESGVPAFVDADSWAGFAAPAGTPPAIVNQLRAEIVKIMQQPDMVSLFNKQGVEPVGNTPQEFATFIKGNIEKWGQAVKFSGATAE